MEPLDEVEVRVLGCLVEKERTVPDSYPLTLNALRNACNQSSSRDPVVSFDEATVQAAVDGLKPKGFVRFVHPSHGERSTKYRHVVDEKLGLERPALAVLSVLALRGPQSATELRARTERQHPFATSDEVERVLEALASREEPLVQLLGRLPGQQHPRWVHLLGGPVDEEALAALAARPAGATSGGAAGATADRLATLEATVAALAERLGRLESELGLDGPQE